MLEFTAQQFGQVQQIAGNLPVEKRAAFIEQTAAYLEWHGFYDDAPDAFERAVDLALRYVTQSAA